MVKRIIYVFAIAFVFNFAWEHFHSVLYVNYKGGEITNAVLANAAIFDASFIALLYYLFAIAKFIKNRWWLMAVTALLFAIGLEIWALDIGRWVYAKTMPLIPFINTGLTPTIQLALTGYLSAKMVNKLTGVRGNPTSSSKSEKTHHRHKSHYYGRGRYYR